MQVISNKRAAFAAMIFGAVVASGCAKNDNYAVDSAAAAVQAADTVSASSTPAGTMAADTARRTTTASKPATKKTPTKKPAPATY